MRSTCDAPNSLAVHPLMVAEAPSERAARLGGTGVLKLTIIVDTWVSDHYGDPHDEVHSPRPAA